MTLGPIERYLDDLVTVEDDDIAEAMVLLLERGKLLAEGAGAASSAALLTGADPRRAAGRRRLPNTETAIGTEQRTSDSPTGSMNARSVGCER